jgi:phosphoribosylcarboxyaminoimidazole (NCAIR) mutase
MRAAELPELVAARTGVPVLDVIVTGYTQTGRHSLAWDAPNNYFDAAVLIGGMDGAARKEQFRKVRKTPSWHRSWANFSLL